MKIVEKDHPFYRPLWRRIVIIALVAAWLGFEVFVSQSPIWMIAAGAMLAYALWTFLIAWPKQDAEKP